MKNKIIEKAKPYVLLAPVLIFLIGIFVYGIILGLIQSLGFFPAIGLNHITLNYYKEVLSDHTFLKSVWFSLYISFTQASISLILGVLFAYALTTRKKTNGFFSESIYKIPIMIPHTVVALFVLIQFSQSGFFARLLFRFNLISEISEFPAIVFDQFGIGIILAYVFKGLPFIALISADIIRDSYHKFSKTALNLGANSFQVLVHVIIPLALPSAFSGFIILFAYSFGSFELPYLLGPSTPNMLPVEAFRLYSSIDLSSRANSMVINMIISFCSFILVGIYYFTYNLLKKLFRGGKSSE